MCAATRRRRRSLRPARERCPFRPGRGNAGRLAQRRQASDRWRRTALPSARPTPLRDVRARCRRRRRFRRGPGARRVSGSSRRAPTAAPGMPSASRPLRSASSRGAPRQQHREAGLREMRDQRAPVRLGPKLVGATARMHEDRVGRLRRRDQRRRDQVEVRRSLGRVAERGRGELPAAIDQMLCRIDPVAVTVAEARRGLADAGAVGTVHRPAREPRQQRALHLLLQIEHQIVTIAGQRAAESRGLAPGRAARAPGAASGAVRPE